jgi:thioredoxin 1
MYSIQRYRIWIEYITKRINIMTIEITDQGFGEAIKSTDKMVLVDFWAEWCSPCRQLAPALEDASNDLQDKITVFKINIDQNPETPSRYSVRGVPTILFFKNGELVDRQVGVLPKSRLYEKIEDVYFRI